MTMTTAEIKTELSKLEDELVGYECQFAGMSVEVPDVLVQMEAYKWLLTQRSTSFKQLNRSDQVARIQESAEKQKKNWKARRIPFQKIYKDNYFSKVGKEGAEERRLKQWEMLTFITPKENRTVKMITSLSMIRIWSHLLSQLLRITPRAYLIFARNSVVSFYL